MRKLPDITPPTTITPRKTDIIEQVREYKLITPLYGGGVVPNEADPVTVVRATEIRGHLRFWWRATRGWQFKDLKAMKDAEDAIWGKAYKKGDGAIPQEQTIQILVEPLRDNIEEDKIEPFKIEEDQRSGRKRSRYDPRTDIPDYAAFPLQYTEEELKQIELLQRKKVLDNVQFRLTILFPASRYDDIAAALWAWETFGGIGARTRRGFGALRCTGIQQDGHPMAIDLPQANQEKVQEWLRENFKRYVVEGSQKTSMPHLKKHDTAFKVVCRENTNDSWSVWANLISKLKSFRQRRYLSKKTGSRSPGRSMWPEPSEIRRLTEQSLLGHTSSIPNPPLRKFPRAVFGLPIIFQFKDRYDRNPNDKSYDPRKTVLQLKTSERFASPLILKPLACQGKAYVGLALILEGEQIEEKDVILKTQKGEKEEWNVSVSFGQKESLIIANEHSAFPIRIDAHANALQAFLKYL